MMDSSLADRRCSQTFFLLLAATIVELEVATAERVPIEDYVCFSFDVDSFDSMMTLTMMIYSTLQLLQAIQLQDLYCLEHSMHAINWPVVKPTNFRLLRMLYYSIRYEVTN